MNYLGKVLSNCKFIYNEINAATLTGAIDVVVVEQPDGTYTCSPFHVRFGKIGVLRSKEKVVDIEINGEPVDIHMKLGESGEAFFVEEVSEGEGEDSFIPPHLACSPIPPEGDRFPQDWPHRLEENTIDNEDNETIQKVPEEAILPGSTPKTFKAETVETNEEAVRKLSTTEFRPISGQENSNKETLDFTKEDSPSADETNTVTVSKRRRRKKSIKKKNSMKRNSVGNGVLQQQSSAAESVPPPAEVIFQMEDLDITPPQQDIPPPLPSPIKEEETAGEMVGVQECAVERDIHFFSDTEITPGSSPREERDFAPVQSDSEFETKRMVANGEGGQNGAPEDHAQSWKWGELPSHEPEDKKQESQRWMLQNMLGFMKKTKHIRHKNDNEGIYLSEVNSEDPEMAALYFPNHYRPSNVTTNPDADYHEGGREEDAESGNGPSLPQSPHSVEGAICGPKSDDFDPNPKWYPEDLALSTCGMESAETFQDHLINFNDLVNDPAVCSNPKLVIRMEGKLYTWQKAAPIVMALFVFRKPLPQEIVSRLNGETDSLIEKQEKQKPSRKRNYSSWFNWSRLNEEKMGEEIDKEQEDQPSPLDGPEKIERASEVTEPLDLSNKSMESDHSSEMKPENESLQESISHEKYRKSLRLSSQQISKLKLRPGANEIEFSVTTAYQGTSRCKCFLFCWRYDDKIVVSDIDGTITKSDVLGHILPIVGKDWAQSGVAKLFTKIKENGYKLLYLSARAIGQSRVTREYLKSIKQEDLTLPEGPMLLNPTSLLNAFHTEVIEKKPEEFKISCLRDIQALFPPHIKPFYAGYGNKINDVWAYQAVGIPIFRIFTINHKGELKHELTQTFQSTYSNMSGLVDQMFPPSKPLSSEDFSEFVYWRDPILDLESIPSFF